MDAVNGHDDQDRVLSGFAVHRRGERRSLVGREAAHGWAAEELCTRLLAAVLAAIAGTLLMFLGLVAALHEITDVDLTGAGPQPDSDLTTIAVVLLGAGLGFVFLALWALVGRQVRGSRRPVRKCRRSRACDT